MLWSKRIIKSNTEEKKKKSESFQFDPAENSKDFV